MVGTSTVRGPATWARSWATRPSLALEPLLGVTW